MKSKIHILFVLLISVLLIGCSEKAPEQPEPIEEVDIHPVDSAEASYPITEILSDPENAYPIMEESVSFSQGPEFTINVPVKAGDLTVKGFGPAGVPIILISVSEVGTVLGETKVDANGTFSFTLKEPLTTGYTIGLQLGDVSNTDFVEADFEFSETYYERPFVGTLFDLAVVE